MPAERSAAGSSRGGWSLRNTVRFRSGTLHIPDVVQFTASKPVDVAAFCKEFTGDPPLSVWGLRSELNGGVLMHAVDMADGSGAKLAIEVFSDLLCVYQADVCPAAVARIADYARAFGFERAHG